MKTVKVDIVEPRAIKILTALADLGLIKILESKTANKPYESESEPEEEFKERIVQYVSNDLTDIQIKDWLRDIRERFSDFSEEELNSEIAEARHENKS